MSGSYALIPVQTKPDFCTSFWRGYTTFLTFFIMFSISDRPELTNVVYHQFDELSKVIDCPLTFTI